ncbi:MAG: hypothetical protein AAGD07_03270 [Planctomycetota bacterium]
MSEPIRSVVITPGNTPVSSQDGSSEGAANVPTETYSRAMVLVILFLVTGVLGIGLLRRCPSMSHLERWFWTLVVTAYTAALIGLAILIVRASLTWGG